MILSELLHQQIEQARNSRQLSVLLQDLGNLTNERPWLVAHAASRSHKLAGRGGFRIASGEMNKDRGRPTTLQALGVSARTWELFHGLRDQFPTVPFSVYRLLYCYGVPIEEVPDWLEKAKALTVRKFWDLLIAKE